MEQQFTYKEAIGSACESLEMGGDVQIVTRDVPGPWETHLTITLDAMEIEIPPGLRQFYEECDGFHLVWRRRDGGAAGEVNIVSCSDTFLVHWKDKLWFDWMDEKMASEPDAAHYKLAKSLLGFDELDTLLDGTVIVALAQDAGAADGYKLWYWDTKGAKFPLTLSAADYIREAIRARGLLRWQLFYADLEADIDTPLLQHLFVRQIHTLLPAMEAVIRESEKIEMELDKDLLTSRLAAMQSFAEQHNLL